MNTVYPAGSFRVPAPGGQPVVEEPDLLVTVEDETTPEYDEKTNSMVIELPDGEVTVTFGPPARTRKTSDFGANLAEELSAAELSSVASTLLEAIERDDQSRTAWMENMSKGISLLGLELKTSPGAASGGGAPQAGVSTVDHPLLLEADLRFQANARGELLPSDGPVKVRNDGPAMDWTSRLADALEKDLNHYLTVTASEYYPDTDRMLLMLGFCGISFKKGYHCPIRRRPVIESIDAKDLIVSNAATNLTGAGRVTHRIMMRPSIIKRMQMLGQYVDTDLPLAAPLPLRDPITQTVDRIQGVAPQPALDTGDQDRELYECYCEIELPGFEHKGKDGEETGLPLPYKVTLDKDARKVLAIYRNWYEDDPLCMPRSRIVAYLFVPGFGFYGIGLLNILGNATKAVTAAWRLMLDAGMFGSFPGFLYLKSLGKQLSNQFNVEPGTGKPIDTVGGDIRAAVMPLPYKDVSPVFIQLVETIVGTAQRVGGTAETAIGEGKQDAPVGTTLALIEQATKVMSAVHKRLHQSQGQEFRILKELLMEDPSALWRHNKKSEVLKELVQQYGLTDMTNVLEQLEEQQHSEFLAALADIELIPCADPNTSSQTERYLKATALKQVQQGNPRIDINAVDLRILRTLGIDDAESLFLPPPQPGAMPPDPNAIAAQAKVIDAQAKVQNAGAAMAEAQNKVAIDQQELQIKKDVAASKERIAQLGVQREAIIHAHDRVRDDQKYALDAQREQDNRQHELAKAEQAHQQGLASTALSNRHDIIKTALEHAHQQRQADLDRKHDMKLRPKPGLAPTKP